MSISSARQCCWRRCLASSSATATGCRSPPTIPSCRSARARRRWSSAPRLSERAGVEVWLKLEGAEPDRLVQGPRDDVRGVGGGARGRAGDHLRLDRQHRRVGRRLRRAGRAALRGDRARGQDRHRQARPGADARRAGDRAARQLRRGAGAGPRADRPPSDLAGQLGQRVPDRGPEDGGVRDRRGARRRARRALHPGRQRRQHHRVLARLSRRPASAPADARLPGRGRGAAGPRRARSSTPRRSRARSGSATRRAGRRRWTR